MSGSGARETPFPTRMALTTTKLRLKGAQTGHSLLAKKRDALTTRFRAILKKVDEVSRAFLFVMFSDQNCILSGETEDGSGDAAGIVLVGGSDIRNWRYIILGPRTGKDCYVQSQSTTRQCIWCYYSCV